MTRVTKVLFLLVTVLALLPAAEAQSTTFMVKPGVALWHVWINPVNNDRIEEKYATWIDFRDKVTELNLQLLKKKGDEPYTHLAPGTQLKLPDDVFASAGSKLVAENAELKTQLRIANDKLGKLENKNSELAAQSRRAAAEQGPTEGWKVLPAALLIVLIILLAVAAAVLFILWRRRGVEIEELRARVYSIHPEPPPAAA